MKDSALADGCLKKRAIPDLLAHKLCVTHFILPASYEEFTQEGIERFFDPLVFALTCILLSLESGQEPLQHQ